MGNSPCSQSVYVLYVFHYSTGRSDSFGAQGPVICSSQSFIRHLRFAYQDRVGKELPTFWWGYSQFDDPSIVADRYQYAFCKKAFLYA